MRSGINNFFKLEELKSNILTEISAGVSTFLALSYIFVVNPAILGEGGMNKSAVLFATVVTSALATLAMGLWARKPFALAPGLEMNGYAVYYVILVLGFSWQNALGIVFWSGILFMILTLTRVREKIIVSIPITLKIGLAASVGVFLMLIALKISGVLDYKGMTINNIAFPLNIKFFVFLVSLVLVVIFEKLKIKISVLLSIIGATIFAHLMRYDFTHIEKVRISSEMFSAFLKLDIKSILRPELISSLIILFVIDFYGSVAKFIGLTLNTPIVDKHGNMPDMKKALSVDGIAALLGATLGTTSVTIYVESGVGINAGGRSGLTAIVCAILMFLFIPLAPIINLVPIEATAGALLWVGLKLIPNLTVLSKWRLFESISVILMLLVTVLTFSLDKSMLTGFLSFLIGLLITKQWKSINPFLIITMLLLLAGFILTLI